MVEIYTLLTQLRPVIDAILGGSGPDRWSGFIYSSSSDDGCGLFIVGVIVGAVVTFFLMQSG